MSQLRVNTVTDVSGTGSTYAPGHVVQVVSASTTTPAETSSTSFVDTGLTATITPKSTSSKILVIVSQQTQILNTISTYTSIGEIRIMRNSTAIRTNDFKLFANAAVGFILSGLPLALEILDSPNTTSAVTYKTMMRRVEANSRIGVQQTDFPSHMTLMEIAQ
jgi:hypothetical protein